MRRSPRALIGFSLIVIAAGGLLAVRSLTGSAQGNAGDVWVDNVGQPAGPGHEQDPHLLCADINLWGNGLAEAAGTFTIDSWPPTGNGATAYGPTGWNYNRTTGGDQVLAVIPISKLLEGSSANGDVPQSQQGLHFKLQFVQDPQKHKTFWVNCLSTSPSPTPTGTSTPTPTPTHSPSPTPTPTGSVTPTPTHSPSGSPSPTSTATATPTTTPTGSPGPTPTPSGGVEATATPAASASPSPSGALSPATLAGTGGGPGSAAGGGTTTALALVLIFLGGLLLARNALRR